MPSKPAAGAAKPEEKLREIPEPEEVSRTTTDGVQLSATFYPGTLKKESVPVICVHDYKRDRGDFAGLAEYLQNMGHAVIVPDLRGHGQSTRLVEGGSLDAASFRPADFKAMVRYDLEAMKSFLMEENNRGELNINKLCVVGAEMGTVVALNWSLLDWSWPPLAIGKQGQDVKGLVLISPMWMFRGMNVSAAMSNEFIRHDLSVLVVVGKGSSKHVAEANRAYKAFERYHPLPPEEDRKTKQDLFLLQLKPKLQGAKLLGENLNLEQLIGVFIEHRLADQSFAWSERQDPLK